MSVCGELSPIYANEFQCNEDMMEVEISPNNVVPLNNVYEPLNNVYEPLNNVMDKEWLLKRSFHKCSSCDKVFMKKTTLYKHYVKTHKQRYKCALCDKILWSPGSLQKHQFLHSQLENCRCDICGKMFTTMVRLKLHLSKHSVIDGDKVVSVTERVLRRRGGVTRYGCGTCEVYFVSKKALNNHNKTKHKTKCSICHITFDTESGTKIHRRKHVREVHPCDECDKKFQNLEAARLHKLTHQKEFSYCKLCGCVFSSAAELTEHELVMHEENLICDKNKSYRCDVCANTFDTFMDLINHKNANEEWEMVEVAVKKKKKKFSLKCNVCEKAFTNLLLFECHNKTHRQRMKQHKCYICGKSLLTWPSLKYHIMKHRK